MGIVAYAILAYTVTAVISFILIGMIVLINFIMNRKSMEARLAGDRGVGVGAKKGGVR